MGAKRYPAAGDSGARNADRVGAATGTRYSTTPAQFPNNLKAVARALGGEVCGREVLAPGPGHSAKDRSLSVRPSTDAPDGLLIHSFAGDGWQYCRDHVRERLGVAPFRPERARAHRIRREPPLAPQDRAQHQKIALRIWQEAVDPRGTLVERYLRSRALELPPETAGSVIRFHASCHMGKECFPCMICLVRHIETDMPIAILRTALTPEGRAVKRDGKTFRMSLGPITGGAVKLDPDEDVTQGICIGEGVETCLAGRLMGYCPAWAVGLAGIASFPILPGIDGLTIFGECDERAQCEKAIISCADRWLVAGREILTAWPLSGNDLNDEFKVAP